VPRNIICLGRNIGRLRNAAGLTQEGLAERADISTRYVQFLEADKDAPSLLVVARLRRALGCSWDELCRGL
jgi:transcriptional regulator with XRE-family HTH domain